MQKVKTIIIVIVVAALAFFAWKLANKDDSNTRLADKALSDFAIDDTASIDKLILTDTEGSPGVTLKREGRAWVSENGECIQQHLVWTILETIKHIKVKSPVGKEAIETINKNLTAHHKKAEIFQNGKLAKVWYIGNPTPDHYGTYMLLKDPELGKSPEPFITYMPTMHGSLRSRFITNPLEFECTGIFNYDLLNIKSVEVVQPDSSQHNFKIVCNDKNNFSLFSNGNEINGFDTTRVRSYLVAYQKIHFEHHNYEYTQHEIDSLREATPYFTIEVEDKGGDKNKVLLYKRKYHFEKMGLDGKPLEWDQDRCWVFLRDGRLTVGQYHVFDKLLRPLNFFLPQQQP